MKARYIHYAISEWLSTWIPIDWGYALARWISRWVFWLSSSERRIVIDNLQRIIKKSIPEKELSRKAAQVYENFGRYCVEFLYWGKAGEAHWRKQFELANIEEVERERLKGRGVILLSLHLGNWELGAMAAAARYPVTIVVQEHPDPRINSLFMKRRLRHGVRVVPTGASFWKCRQALRRNELVGLVGDRRYTSDGVVTDFFGAPALLPRGPSFLAMKTGAPVILCYMVRRHEGDPFRLYFEPAIDPGAYPDETSLNRVLASRMEAVIEKYPTQWFAFESLWHPLEKALPRP